jgi:hypothetical protein
MVHMPVAEWGQGKHLYLAFHDGVFCHPEKGVVFPCESTNLYCLEYLFRSSSSSSTRVV